MGSVLAMIAVVTVVAGVATVTTNKLHQAFSSATPKAKTLRELLTQWRERLSEKRADLTKLKVAELDLLSYEVTRELKLLSGRNRDVGYFNTIYKEPVGYYVRQRYPKAKSPHALTLVQTQRFEIVYRQVAGVVTVDIDGAARFRLSDAGELTDLTGAPRAARTLQRDERTLHVDTAAGKTLGILHRAGGGNRTALRAFEFVDVDDDVELLLLTVLTYDYLLSQNLSADG